jgi:hypothetical protein
MCLALAMLLFVIICTFGLILVEKCAVPLALFAMLVSNELKTRKSLLGG